MVFVIINIEINTRIIKITVVIMFIPSAIFIKALIVSVLTSIFDTTSVLSAISVLTSSAFVKSVSVTTKDALNGLFSPS